MSTKLPRCCFIIGHARSGSSLLVHLLASHPELAGWGEMHANYCGWGDQARLWQRVQARLPGDSPRWMFDKVLYGRYLRDPLFFSYPGRRYLFLVREPAATLASMFQLFNKRPGHPYATPASQSRYYLRRMVYLRWVMRLTGRRAVFLTYGDLLHQTTAAFRAIEGLLGLQQPLKEAYAMLPTTGERRTGDSSAHIKAGKILRDKPTHQPWPGSAEAMAQALRAYARTEAVGRRLYPLAN